MSKEQYNPEFPEAYQWELIDSISLSELACTLAKTANGQQILKPEYRNLLPGLRVALHAIAEQVGIA